jgi:membrane protein insertase Oxa1/YidC/SpoIIIJ
LLSRSMMQSMPQPQSSDSNDMAAIMSKQMTYLGPAMIFLFALRVGAGLSLYWVVASLIDWYVQVAGVKRYQATHATELKATVSIRQKKG